LQWDHREKYSHDDDVVNLEVAHRAVEGGDKARINRSVGDARQPTCDE
jgi:hypothetical protein